MTNFFFSSLLDLRPDTTKHKRVPTLGVPQLGVCTHALPICRCPRRDVFPGHSPLLPKRPSQSRTTVSNLAIANGEVPKPVFSLELLCLYSFPGPWSFQVKDVRLYGKNLSSAECMRLHEAQGLGSCWLGILYTLLLW